MAKEFLARPDADAGATGPLAGASKSETIFRHYCERLSQVTNANQRVSAYRASPKVDMRVQKELRDSGTSLKLQAREKTMAEMGIDGASAARKLVTLPMNPNLCDRTWRVSTHTKTAYSWRGSCRGQPVRCVQ